MGTPRISHLVGRRARHVLATALLCGLVAAGCAFADPPNYRTPADNAWWTAHQELVYTLVADAQDVAFPSSDVPGYEGKCKKLGDSLTQAKALPKLQAKKLNVAFKRALDLINASVTYCAQSYSADVNTDTIDQATSYRLAAMNNASFAQVRLRTFIELLGGSVSMNPKHPGDDSTTTTVAAAPAPTPTP